MNTPRPVVPYSGDNHRPAWLAGKPAGFWHPIGTSLPNVYLLRRELRTIALGWLATVATVGLLAGLISWVLA